jgi:hypothetical protein
MAFSEAQDYHDVYVDGVTQFKPTHMNLPIDQLDYQVGVNIVQIALRMRTTDFMCWENEILCVNNEPITTFM